MHFKSFWHRVPYSRQMCVLYNIKCNAMQCSASIEIKQTRYNVLVNFRGSDRTLDRIGFLYVNVSQFYYSDS